MGPELETLVEVEVEAKNETLSDAEELVDLEILVEEPTDHEVLIETPEETVEKVTEKPKKAVLFKPSDKPIEPQSSPKAPLLIPSPTLSSHLQNVDPKNIENTNNNYLRTTEQNINIKNLSQEQILDILYKNKILPEKYQKNKHISTTSPRLMPVTRPQIVKEENNKSKSPVIVPELVEIVVPKFDSDSETENIKI